MPVGRPPKRPSDGLESPLHTPSAQTKSKHARLERGPEDFSSVVKSKLQSYSRTGQACDRCKVCSRLSVIHHPALVRLTCLLYVGSLPPSPCPRAQRAVSRHATRDSLKPPEVFRCGVPTGLAVRVPREFFPRQLPMSAPSRRGNNEIAIDDGVPSPWLTLDCGTGPQNPVRCPSRWLHALHAAEPGLLCHRSRDRSHRATRLSGAAGTREESPCVAHRRPREAPRAQGRASEAGAAFATLCLWVSLRSGQWQHFERWLEPLPISLDQGFRLAAWAILDERAVRAGVWATVACPRVVHRLQAS